MNGMRFARRGSSAKRLNPHTNPLTDPATPYLQQPVGHTGYGDPIMSEEFGGAVTVVNAGTGLVRFRSGGPSWATWYPDWPRFNAQSPGGNHTNTGEDCYYATSKVTVSGGELILACDEVATGGLPYTAGMIQSLNFYTPETGYFEARIKLESIVNGTWPAWWASCSNFDQWPPEIDFWEQFGPATTYESHVYLSGSSYNDTGNAATMTNYNVYGCRWTASAVTFYLNGTQTGTTSSQVPSEPLYLILKNGAREPANPTFDSCNLYVDYIRCWELP